MAQDQARAQIELDSINMATSTPQIGPNEDGVADEDDEEGMENEGDDDDDSADDATKEVATPQEAGSVSSANQFLPR